MRAWLAGVPVPVFTIYAMVAGFTAYFSMYAFRKPFAAASFEGQQLGPLELKTALVISQIIGYALSKYVGIKVCSEATPERRARALVLIILWAEAALFLFALVPGPLKVVAIFLNGLSLGMVWGMVVGYLEGRRTSEVLLAALCCSFILSSGVVKDVGRALMNNFAVSESWMPAVTGLCFLPAFLISVWCLHQMPSPTAEDVDARVLREPMDKTHRIAFLRHFLPGLVLLFTTYLFLTAYRDVRDNYGIELFKELGFGETPAIFTRSELPVAFGSILALAALNLIKDNRLALYGAYAMMIAGTLLMGAGTLLFQADRIDGLTWMILTGLGVYLAYVPFNAVLFDRMIASTHVVGTAVFAIYVADAIGYTGSVGVQLFKDLVYDDTIGGDFSWLGFFTVFTYFLSIVATILLVASCAYFMFAHSHHRSHEAVSDAPEISPL